MGNQLKRCRRGPEWSVLGTLAQWSLMSLGEGRERTGVHQKDIEVFCGPGGLYVLWWLQKTEMVCRCYKKTGFSLM